jgi:PAS domain S-box-containing protein
MYQFHQFLELTLFFHRYLPFSNLRRGISGGLRADPEGESTVSAESAHPLRDAARGVEHLRLVERAQPSGSSDELRMIVDTSDDFICVTELDGRFRWLNRAFSRKLGYGEGELEGVQSLQLIHPDDVARVLSAARSGANAITVGFRFKHARGHWLDVEMNRRITYDELGQPTGTVIISRDVTERKSAEERFRLLSEHSPIGIYIAQDRAIRYVNPRFEALTGYSSDELIGSDPLQLVIAEDRQLVHDCAVAMLKGERETEYEYRIAHKSGDTRWIMENLVSIEYEGRRAALGNYIDITERKRADQELEKTLHELARSNEELGQFAYVASHDLQEPLRMVASFTQLLGRRYKGKLDEDADEFIRYAVDGVNRMQQLINDLLDYSRVGTRGNPMVAVDCNRVAERVLDSLYVRIQENDATIDLQPLPVVTADPVQMEQLLQNLVGNALKYRGEASPVVRVSASEEDGGWHFEVKDNGIGIDPAYAERIFVIFQRLHGKEEYEGTGIGLAICKKIVDRHGGHIWVESNPEGGSTFHFTLPQGGATQ